MLAIVLSDNIADGDFQGEWGLSIYIEYNGKNFLLDTGASNLFVQNANKLGKSIKAVDYCYSKKRIFHKYIGLPKHILTDFHDRITYVEEDYEIIPGVYLIPHKTPNLKLIGKRERMYRREHHQWIYDNFSHEQSLVFRTEKGLVIFNSCCHGGIGNIIHEVAKTFPAERVYGIIGGFHLFNKSDEEIDAVIRQIKDAGIKYVCTGHCTGGHAYKILKSNLGDMIHQLKVGMQIEL